MPGFAAQGRVSSSVMEPVLITRTTATIAVRVATRVRQTRCALRGPRSDLRYTMLPPMQATLAHVTTARGQRRITPPSVTLQESTYQKIGFARRCGPHRWSVILCPGIIVRVVFDSPMSLSSARAPFTSILCDSTNLCSLMAVQLRLTYREDQSTSQEQL